jgi:Tfp pilus assembly protein FimT
VSQRLIILAILGLVAFPGLQHLQRRVALHIATGDVRSILQLARMRAIVRDAGTAVHFTRREGVWHYAIHDDGDGDGVRLSDIAKGIDPPIAPLRPVLDSSVVAIEHVNDPALCAFTPNRGATPCVISITDDEGRRGFVTQRGLS